MGSGIKIVADAGGTKTNWWVRCSSGEEFRISTGGINAAVSNDEEILTSVEEMAQRVRSAVPDLCENPIELFFYGAGCNSLQAEERLVRAFNQVLAGCLIHFEFHTDLEGAARALFGDDAGIACILGTGSATGLYNGKYILKSIPSLGFILGDEGSGAYMGKLLLNRYYKLDLSPSLKGKLEAYGIPEQADTIRRVYREESPNRFLASFVPFIKENENDAEISRLIDESLKLFFEANVLKYKDSKISRIGFVGGVANAFSARLEKLAAGYNMEVVCFLTSPIDSLTRYYQK